MIPAYTKKAQAKYKSKIKALFIPNDLHAKLKAMALAKSQTMISVLRELLDK